MFFENTQGDANSIYLTSAVKAVGGWPEDDRALYDWGLWLKLIGSGYRTDVIPKVLYYYRWRSESDTAVKSVFEVEESNIKAVQNIVEKSPKLFSRHYRALHRLVRSPGQTIGWRQSKQTDELMAQPEGLGGLPVLPEGATMDVWFKSGITGKALHAMAYYYLYSGRWGRRAAIRKMMRDGLRRRI
jgi:hypothetical protein